MHEVLIEFVTEVIDNPFAGDRESMTGRSANNYIDRLTSEQMFGFLGREHRQIGPKSDASLVVEAKSGKSIFPYVNSENDVKTGSFESERESSATAK